jgi:6-phosphogluconolactonase
MARAVSSPVSRDVVVLADPAALAREAARRIRLAAQAAIADRGVCTVALSGGRTPRAVYERLAEPPVGPDEAIDWSAVQLWFGDERHVPPDHPDSNFRMVQESLASRVPIPSAHVHRMRTEEADSASVASAYEGELMRGFGVGPRAWPRFDLVLLGMGSDGHTASLFPGTPVLGEREHMAAAVWVTSLQSSRVTLTYPVINHARTVIVLVTGAEKAETLHAVMTGSSASTRYPIEGVRPVDGQMVWLVDAAAASRL